MEYDIDLPKKHTHRERKNSPISTDLDKKKQT